MGKDRGVALILALLVLSFLTVLGSALLTTSTIDLWISDNYKSATQTLYIAEAGIDHGREVLRISNGSLSQLLGQAAGADYQIMTADDQAFIASRTLLDADGRAAGSYEVWLRNDQVEGPTVPADSNNVVTLVSIGRIGNTRKTIETTVQKGGFPDNPSDPRLQSTPALETLVRSLTQHATDTYYQASAMNAFGAPGDYRVGVVEGNLEFGPGTGYGLLLVRGELHITGETTWNGLILVIGQGVVRWSPGVSSTVTGGFFSARTKDVNGSLLAAPLDVMYTVTDRAVIQTANRRFPYNPIAIWER